MCDTAGQAAGEARRTRTYGASGTLQGLAKKVAAGAEEEGALVRVLRVPEHAMSGDGESAGLTTRAGPTRWVLGSPSRYGNVGPQLKSYVEALEILGGRVWGSTIPRTDSTASSWCTRSVTRLGDTRW